MIALEIGGGVDSVATLRSFPDRLAARLLGVMETLGIALQNTVRDNLGGKILRKRSGRLAAGVDVAVTAAGSAVGVSVSVAGVPYAAYQEYGFRGTETVRAHLRTIKEAFGRPIAPRAVAVRSFGRRVDYPAHSYLRSALAAVAPQALAQIDDAAAEEAALSNREPIYAALLALLANRCAGFTTASRRLRHWSDVAAVEQPALFVAQKGETAEQKRGLPTKWICDVDAYVYCHAPDELTPPTTVLNPLLDAIEAALAPQAGGDVAANVQTLGGLAYQAWINGKIETDEGTLGGQSVAIVPIRIVVS